MMNKKILVVDDSAVNRFVIESMLTDFDLIEAENGDEMYNALKNNSVNLILLDIMMPGKSGLELAEELREDTRYENIPIIFVSAKSSGEDIKVGLSIGVDDYIVKPVDESILRARISSVMRRASKTDMLNALATTDPLTGLYNRRFFFKRAEEEWNLAVRKNKKLAIAMIDIDHFKRVNDTFGHDNGDIVLKEMAKIISDGLRSCDVVARYGGEEFVLFLSDCTKEEALIKISEIRDVILITEFDLGDEKVKITFTAGIADKSDLDNEFTSDSEHGIARMISFADKRLYYGKNTGRDKISIRNEE